VLAAEIDFGAIADELVAASRGQGMELMSPNGLVEISETEPAGLGKP